MKEDRIVDTSAFFTDISEHKAERKSVDSLNPVHMEQTEQECLHHVCKPEWYGFARKMHRCAAEDEFLADRGKQYGIKQHRKCSLSFEDNIAVCKKVAEAAHAVNVSVEGELGTIGSTDAQAEAGANTIIYTDPDAAVKFVEATGVDTLAIAIGTSHGIYPKGMKPELKLDLLKVIKSKVSIPLVLHGGSNNPDAEIGQSVTLGVNKINISSDIKVAYYEKMREVLKDESLREPNVIQPACIAAMKETAYHKIELFQADGKAALYR